MTAVGNFIVAFLFILVFSRLLWLFAGSWKNSVPKAMVLDGVMGLIASVLLVGNISGSNVLDYGKSFAVCMSAAALIYVFDAIRVIRGARATPIDYDKPTGFRPRPLRHDVRILGSVVALIVLVAVVSVAFSNLGDDARVKNLTEIQKTLPKRIDLVTTLIDVRFDGKVMTYTYVVETGMQPFGDAAIQVIKDRHCGSFGWRGYSRDEHRYTDRSGKQLIAIARNRDCR